MRFCGIAMSVDADRFDDRCIRSKILPSVTVDGKPISVAEFRRLCADARAKGYRVIPQCDNTKPNGHCAGHVEQEDMQALIAGGES